MKKKCKYCGGFLPDTPFYFLNREPLGTLNVWVCPNCGKKVEEWVTSK